MSIQHHLAMNRNFQFLLLFATASTFGQQVNDFDKQTKVNAFGSESSNTIRQIKAEYEGVKGNPYLVKDFRPGKLKLLNNKEIKNTLINVDLITNNVLVKQSKTDSSYWVNKKELIECEIQIDFDTIVIVRKIDLPKKESQMCVVLYEDKNWVILIHPTKQILKADYSGAYNQGKNYDEIVDSYDYYYSRNDSIGSFQLKKKSIAELFPKDKQKLNTYLNKKPVNLKDWHQLKALFVHMGK